MKSILFRFLITTAILVASFLCSPTRASATPLQVTGLGGWKNIYVYVPHTSGSTWEFSEDVVVYFNKTLNFPTFRYGVTPASATSAQVIGDTRFSGDGAEIHLRKVPNTTYTITIPAGVRAADGTALLAPYVFRVTVPPAPPIPRPIRSTLAQPYRYGILANVTSLGPPNDAQELLWDVNAGVRFIRIDYCGNQIERTKGVFDWTVPDSVMDQLASRGITELPTIEGYCAPSWATGGSTGIGQIWQQPQDYADFAQAIAQHVAGKYPQITRLDLFNEPNLQWKNGNTHYASKDGSAAGIYMKGAYASIKSVAPSISVVGPTTAPGNGIAFLSNMYKVGCHRGNCWDILALNNYAWYNPTFTSPYTTVRWDIYKDLQKLAAGHGDAGAHVMLTEWGYSTLLSSPSAFDSRVQAYYLALGFNLMLSDPTVDGIVWSRMYSPATNDFWQSTSLINYSGNLLPTYAAFQKFGRF